MMRINSMLAERKQWEARFETKREAHIPTHIVHILIRARTKGVGPVIKWDRHWLAWAKLYPYGAPNKTIPGGLTARGAKVAAHLLPVAELLDGDVNHPAAKLFIHDAEAELRRVAPHVLLAEGL